MARSAGWRVRILAAFTALAITILFTAPLPTAAHMPFLGSSNCGPDLELSNCVANNRDHQVHYYQVLAPQLNESRWVMTNVYAPTDVESYETTISNADVIVYDFTFGMNGWWGVVYCGPGASQGGSDPDRWCRPFTLQYNLSYGFVYDNYRDRRYIACHEFGHTLGLRDVADGATCMDDTQIVWLFLSGHQVSDLNEQY